MVSILTMAAHAERCGTGARDCALDGSGAALRHAARKRHGAEARDRVDDDERPCLLRDRRERLDVRDEGVEILPDDVEVDMANHRVTVVVRRTADRGSAVATWFARVFGVEEVDIAARATAEAAPAGAATCLKPFTLPDAWDDEDEDGAYDPGETYDPPQTGYGSDWRDGQPTNNGIDPNGTTYEDDFGRPLVIKEGSPDEAIVSSWYFPWDIPRVDGDPPVGGARYRWNIANCNTSVVNLGDEYMVENGNMTGPTKQGIEDLIAKDKNAEWDADADSVVGSAYRPWKASPRVAKIPLFDPTREVRPGKKPIVFNNFTDFWIDGMQGKDVIGRFLYASGIGVGSAGAGIVADSRPGHVRISPYFYNVPDDHRAAIERLIS